MEKEEKIPAEELLNAYCNGYFPMAMEEMDNEIGWFKPDPRTILPIEKFHASKSLLRKVRSEFFEIRVSSDFEGVIRACAAPRKKERSTWISEDIIELYTEVHKMGFAQSVECWKDNELVGGVYGISIAGAFFGESMFHKMTDASKVALYHLVEILKMQSFLLFDVQYGNSHTQQFGIEEIPAAEYDILLDAALKADTEFNY